MCLLDTSVIISSSCLSFVCWFSGCALCVCLCVNTHTFSHSLPISHLHITNNHVCRFKRSHTALLFLHSRCTHVHSHAHRWYMLPVYHAGFEMTVAFMPCIDSSHPGVWFLLLSLTPCVFSLRACLILMSLRHVSLSYL